MQNDKKFTKTNKTNKKQNKTPQFSDDLDSYSLESVQNYSKNQQKTFSLIVISLKICLIDQPSKQGKEKTNINGP